MIKLTYKEANISSFEFSIKVIVGMTKSWEINTI